MKMPRLTGTRPAGDTLIQFKGYNNSDGAGKGEFTAMENMSSDRHPLLSPRKPRGTVMTLGKANGFLAREKMLWVDGDKLYYDGNEVCTVEDSEKTMISYGAYVIVFPDKIMYNTADGTVKQMEHKYTSTGTVSWKSAYLTDTSLSAEGQTYVEITASGIAEGFELNDGVELSGFSNESLNGWHVIKEVGDGFIKIIGAIDKAGSQTTAVTIERKLPECDCWTVAENRLWGCSSKNHEIYGSALGNPANFYNYEGLADSSYAATIAGDGEFTGAITYLGYVMFFKENGVHKLHGNKPGNYQIMEGQLRGVAKGCSKSLQIVNEVLYYKSASGIMSFQGSLPYEVGANIEGDYGVAEAGGVGNKYYISMEKDGKYHLFVYDAAKNLWHREDNTHARWFSKSGEKLYYVEGDTVKTMVGDDDVLVDWSAETSDFTYQMADSKFISRVSVRCEVESRGSLEVWIDYDSKGDWKMLRNIGTKAKGIVNVPVIPARCDHFKLKFSGYGKCAIHDMTIYLTTGSNERKW